MCVRHVSDLLTQIVTHLADSPALENDSLALIGCQALVAMVMMLGDASVFDMVPVSAVTKALR